MARLVLVDTQHAVAVGVQGLEFLLHFGNIGKPALYSSSDKRPSWLVSRSLKLGLVLASEATGPRFFLRQRCSCHSYGHASYADMHDFRIGGRDRDLDDCTADPSSRHRHREWPFAGPRGPGPPRLPPS